LGLAAGPTDAGTRGPKRRTVSEIIVHATGGPVCQGGRVRFTPAGDLERMQRFFAASPVVSIHYIVGRDGRVAASVPEDEVAVHTRGHNERAIGIELINAGDGSEPYPDEQMQALARLIHQVRTRWGIALIDIKGHDEVDHSTFICAGRTVRRKQDPGPKFPWNELRIDLILAETEAPVAARR
jgi:N-acetyl-anhydromuramyl-L-alanine amidase AmpD